MAALIDVAFIVVGGPKLLPKARQAATHLNATSSLPVRIHLVSDKPLPRQPWFELHLLSAMPAAADVLHRLRLGESGVGGGAVVGGDELENEHTNIDKSPPTRRLNSKQCLREG